MPKNSSSSRNLKRSAKKPLMGRSKSSQKRTAFDNQFSYEKLEPKNLLAGDLGFACDSLLVAKATTPTTSVDQVWQSVSKDVLQTAQGTNYIKASDFGLFDIDEANLQELLSDAPLEFTDGYRENAITLSVPAPDQTFRRFAIVEAPIMEQELAEKYSNIKTYRGVGIDNPSDTIRLDFTPQGFHAAVRSAVSGDYYVDPYFHLDTSLYMSYYSGDLQVDPDRIGERLVLDPDELGHKDDGDKEDPAGPAEDGPFGSQLRTYQLAVAATGEYTAFHGGTVAAGQAAIVTSINRVVGIYENDVAVRMILVNNNDDLVFTNASTDPYTNNNGGAMLSQNQTTVDSVIGSANYDVGHVFSTGGGGVAFLGVIGQNGSKAGGVTGLPSPIGDPFNVDYVAHELGHQFGATHTFNGDSGSCAGGNRTGATAYEPGSGSTIMGYAGICGNDNLQSNSHAFFHSASLDDIINEITTGTGQSSATITNTGDAIPTVNGGQNFVIPDQTPFELTAVGADADSGDTLTYSWEQRDLGAQRDLSAGDNGSSPLFRTWEPTTNPTRSFPQLSSVLACNTAPLGEQLPTTNWNSMDFRVVVRDNAFAHNTDDISLQVVNAGSGFSITSQNSATDWQVGDTETITWNVSGTNANGINVSNVDILWSSDGGVTFDTTLVANVANDGSQTITVPSVATATGRIKIVPVGNIFYDINNANISIGVQTTTTQYPSTDTPLGIPDNNPGGISSTITVPNDGEIIDLDLQLNISHTWDSDLTATLTAPDGTVFTLFSGVGGDGDNFTNTIFDDSAATSINSGSAPFNGSFQPVSPFGPLNGTQAVGDWTLTVIDGAGQDVGTLNSWSLFISYAVANNTDITTIVDSNSSANTVSESASTGATVGITAFANDPDASDTVSYALTNTAGGRFAINSSTGVVTVAGALDYETNTSHTIGVRATSTDTSVVNQNFTIAVTNDNDAVFIDHQLFYNGSSFDDGAVGAIATDKSVLLPGQTATFANYTSYINGINGFVIDLNDLNVAPTLGTVGNFFEFRVGNDNTPSGWATAPAPTGLTYDTNIDAAGTDRIYLTWADGAIVNTWLEVRALANASTGLSTPDVSYIGNAIGEVGNSTSDARVNLVDVGLTRGNQTGFTTALITNNYDFDRDGRVNLVDVGLARVNQSGFTSVSLISPPANRGTSIDGSKDSGTDVASFENSALDSRFAAESAIELQRNKGNLNSGSWNLAGSQTVQSSNDNGSTIDTARKSDEVATDALNTDRLASLDTVFEAAF